MERLKAEEDARETALRLGRETDAETLCLPYGRGGLLAAVYFTALARRSGVEIRLRAAGIPAACIGRLVPGLDKCVVDKTEREYINRPEKGITLEAEVFETERTKDA